MGFARAMARGFSLIEMAIVLVVIGILLSGGLMAVAPVLDGTKQTQTNQKLDTIEKALVLYVIRNGCLPCPTDGSSPANTAGLAQGDAPGTYSAGCVDSHGGDCAVVGGDAVVPWGALGLSRDDVTDGWNNYITYVVASDLVEDASSMVRTPPSNYPDGNLIIESATPGGTTPVTLNAAYVLISHGKDGAGARTPAGGIIANPNASNTVQDHNAAGVCFGGTPCHQDTPYDINGADKFDDIVRWRTAPMIIQLCGSNACGNPA